MMGGYVEDINDYSTTAGKTNYRFHHFGITDIFIYFSHYNFTIPPKGWIETCHNNGTLCLGTFIIEREIDYVKKETADYLIYLARHHGFDGYLINIEYSVNSVEKFKTWLQYLVVELHNRLPGSKVIWYDSIISSGKLQWQSELNDSNAEFF
jgi:mannosyl-glycoprotein endo-beta-N-acetylglucosaminidase